MNTTNKKRPEIHPFTLYAIVVAIIVGSTGIAFYFDLFAQDSIVEKEVARWGKHIYDDLHAEIRKRDLMIDRMATSFDKIDANLQTIRAREENAFAYQFGEEIPGDLKDRVIRDVRLINTLLMENQMELARLQDRVTNSGLTAASLETRIARLGEEMKRKEGAILNLKNDLSARNEQLAEIHLSLTEAEINIALQDVILEKQEKEILRQKLLGNAAFYTIGPRDELKAAGLIKKSGGFLGLGGQAAFTADVSSENFEELDVREHTRIPLSGGKPEIVTRHPAGSYQFEKDAEGEISALSILEPEAFWKTSRYLVVAMN